MAALRRRSAALVAAPVVVGLLLVGLVASGAGPFGDADGERAGDTVAATTAVATPASTTTTSAPAPTTAALPRVVARPAGTLVADATGPRVQLHTSPGGPPSDVPELANPTPEGLAVVFRVLEERGDWLRVGVSARPNGREAWVRRAQVALRTVPNRVVVEVGARRVSVLRGDRVLLRETVAVGTDRTPTPLGSFFVDGIVRLADGTGPYGTHQVSVSGFSDVLRSFGGGVGQIALHGTNRPDLLGEPVSNGCVRLSNDAIARLADLAPTGTPVEIVA